MNEEQAKALREPFPADAIGKLPRAGTTLDYVGHAAVTDRLLAVDPGWSWEPVAFAEDGAPLIRYGAKEATLWIRLLVCGVVRLGVGIAKVDAFELDKQLISDAIRNAAMRFGVALDLWSKQDLHDDVAPDVALPEPEPVDRTAIDAIKSRLISLPPDATVEFTAWKQTRAFPWPWTVDACVAMAHKLDALEAAAEEPF